MKAYHLRTNEPDSHDMMGRFERFDLDSIYIPERSVLVGFIKHSTTSGMIKSYMSHYCSRSQDIVEGNRNGVQGDVVSELELEADKIDKIVKHYSEKEVKTKIDYNYSTSALVGILSDEFVKKGLLSRLFSRH